MNYNESNYGQLYQNKKGTFSRLWNPNEVGNPVLRRGVNIAGSTVMSLLTAVIGGSAIKILSGNCETYLWDWFVLCDRAYGAAGAAAALVLAGATGVMWYRTLTDW